MILVTVGMHAQGFDRLVRAADELASQIEEPVFIQYGSSNYVPRYAQCSQWITSTQMEQLNENARVIIAHAAAGAVILALKLAKPLVLVPRAKRYGEHIDDHQQQLAAALSADNQAVSVVEPTPATLQQAIDRCMLLKPVCLSNRSLVLSLKRQLNQWNTVKTLDP